jgi:hypothetical protein
MRKVMIAVLLLGSLRAFAQDAGSTEPPPPADEIKRVLDYYYNGKDRGPALVELKACLKVDSAKGSATLNECIEEVKGPVKVNQAVHAWLAWYVPKGGSYEDVSVQFLLNGEVRSTQDIKLEGEGRTRTWRTQAATKKGKWTVKVTYKGKELGSTTYTAE